MSILIPTLDSGSPHSISVQLSLQKITSTMKVTSEWMDKIILECGGFGRYQIMLMAIIFFFAKISPTWSTLVMSIAGSVPDWWCQEIYQNTSDRNTSDYLKQCSIDNGSQCESFHFEDSMGTIVSEWGLVCDKAWISSTITSIQMAGNFVSALVCGHISDFFGRKPTLYMSTVMFTLLNFVAYFSVSWHMFAVIRFFLGFAIGNYFAVYFPLLTEFIPIKKRPLILAIPSWTIWAALLGIVAWLIPSWQNLHLTTAAVSFPLLFTWWLIPESFRWLLAKNRPRDAEAVIIKMAKINGKPVPDLSLLKNRACVDEKSKTYTAKDLFRTWRVAKSTLLLTPMWIIHNYTYYAIMFGVQELSGSIYLNLFLLSIIQLPGNLLTYLFSNKLGRKWTCVLFDVLSGVAAFGVAIADVSNIDPGMKGNIINGFALTTVIGTAAGWCALATLTAETYPTVIRTIGYGFQTTIGRIGSIVAPQFVYLSQIIPGMMYFVCGATMILSAICAWLCEETRHKTLQDTFDEKDQDNEQPLETKTESLGTKTDT